MSFYLFNSEQEYKLRSRIKLGTDQSPTVWFVTLNCQVVGEMNQIELEVLLKANPDNSLSTKCTDILRRDNL